MPELGAGRCPERSLRELVSREKIKGKRIKFVKERLISYGLRVTGYGFREKASRNS